MTLICHKVSIWVTAPAVSGSSLAVFSFSGDGGNDVSMIQEADCGVGVEGKVRATSSQSSSPVKHTAAWFRRLPSICARCVKHTCSTEILTFLTLHDTESSAVFSCKITSHTYTPQLPTTDLQHVIVNIKSTFTLVSSWNLLMLF